MVDWGQGAEGAAGGAAAGTTILPGWGTAIGAGIGGLWGLFGGSGNDAADQQKKMLMDYYQQILHRTEAPQQNAQYSGFRQNQADLINHLEALSNGKGPSLAMAQLQAATDKNVASQQAMAASGRGGPLASAQAANNIMRTGAQASQDSVGARIQEEQMALGMLGQNINAGRGADENVNTANASNNLAARLKLMGMNDDAIQAIIAGMGGQAKIPQMGDKLLAGGVSMLGNKYGQGGGNQFGGGQIGSPAPINFGNYQRNPDGSTGPITSPSQSY